MFQLTKEVLLNCFNEINRRLSLKGSHGEVIIAGGAAMMLAFDARNATYDIDAVFHPKEELLQIIKEMKNEYMLNIKTHSSAKADTKCKVFYNRSVYKIHIRRYALCEGQYQQLTPFSIFWLSRQDALQDA